MKQEVRVRFAPSPTGGLHLGGVRTVLYNYLFARQHEGKFIVRIEDTDQSRFVEGAEKYIFNCLHWCGLAPDESTLHGGSFGPYRQSERKELYRSYAEKLIKEGKAYYAFDTPEALESMREKLKSEGSSSLQYDHKVRGVMKNSLSMTAEEVKSMIESGAPYVIRIKMDPERQVNFTDLIRGEVSFDCAHVDDKVLLKADGMPTYHLAVVVDDHMMQVTHAFRGEEWLPSAPVHIILWEYLFGLENMPLWAHLPLILKPDGHGKLSKRDGERLGIPVYAMNWQDPNTGLVSQGFKELGFLPEAFVNFLAMLGWNDGTEKEIFSLEELIQSFSIERIHKGGAKFDFEKAKWYNHEWIKRSSAKRLLQDVRNILEGNGVSIEDEVKLLEVIDMVKDRCTLLTDFYDQSAFFFRTPEQFDTESVQSKWNSEKLNFFADFIKETTALTSWDTASIEACFKATAGKHQIKVGELQLLFRIMLVGSKIGPAVFAIAAVIGAKETINRIQKAIQTF